MNDMACHKILIDYSEYVRLKAFEARYEQESLGDGEEQKGHGLLSLPVETPVMGKSESITTPPNATTSTTKSEFDLGQTESPTVHPLSNNRAPQQKKWYFLGIPEKTS